MESDQEAQFIACLLVNGPPRRKINDMPNFGLSATMTYKIDIRDWFVASGIRGEFLIGDTTRDMGQGWWVDYKQWLWDHGCKQEK